MADLELRDSLVFKGTRADECARMLDEYSSRWMTEEEEKAFKDHAQAVFDFASRIDYVVKHRGNVATLHWRWRESPLASSRLPKFVVRTDLEVKAGDAKPDGGQPPPRTGIYVSQTDPNATLQFAWTGDEWGGLDESPTLNALGLRAVAALGRDTMWDSSPAVTRFTTQAWRNAELSDTQGMDPGGFRGDEQAVAFLSANCIEAKPQSWYFVELVEGEFDDEHVGSEQASGGTAKRLRCEGGQPCPQAGYWATPAQANSRRAFKAGELMPEFKAATWGATIWYLEDAS
jgi:hypothetical protein